MTLVEWIDALESEPELEFWRRAAHFFNTRELKKIMDYVSRGYSLTVSHKKAGVLDKYPVDLFRTAEIIIEKYPDSSPEPLSR